MDFTSKVQIEFGCDCNLQDGDTGTEWDKADIIMDKVNTFVANENTGKDPEVDEMANADPRFIPVGGKLYVKIVVPTDTISDAGSIWTRFANNIDDFAPFISAHYPTFNFRAEGIVPDPEPEPE